MEKWAHHRGDQSSRGAGIFVGQRVEPVLRIHHGSAPIYVRDLGKCLMVLGAIELVPDLRAELRRMPEPDRDRFLTELRKVLTSCPRIGFGLTPQGARDATELERVVLDQTLQVAENDSSSFNRFCDAVQETETILLRAIELIETFVASEGASLTYSSGTPPPTDIYQ